MKQRLIMIFKYGQSSVIVKKETPLYPKLDVDLNIIDHGEYKEIKSHHHISQYLTYLLGYNKKLILSNKDHIINGTMLSREDRFITIKEQK